MKKKFIKLFPFPGIHSTWYNAFMNTDYHYNHFEDFEKLHDVDLYITIELAPFHENVVTIGLYDYTLELQEMTRHLNQSWNLKKVPKSLVF